MVTLRDLALACDCSVTSASRALKNHKTISKKLREKVQKAALDLGYIPNNIAGSMRTGITKTVAVIMQETLNPYFSILTNTLEMCIAQSGYTALILTTGCIAEREIMAVHEALRKKVDGILLFPFYKTEESVKILERADVPFVLVGRDIKDLILDCVRADDQHGMYLATKHMLETGRKRLMLLNSFDFISSACHREAGFRQAVEEFGMVVAPEDMYQIATDKGHCSRAINSIFSQGIPYDAICCYCDVIAFEAYYQLKQLGIKCPEDVAITGVDNLHSYITFPVKLTSAAYDIDGIAKKSVELIIEKIRHKKEQENNPVPVPWQPRFIMFNQYLSVGETT